MNGAQNSIPGKMSPRGSRVSVAMVSAARRGANIAGHRTRASAMAAAAVVLLAGCGGSQATRTEAHPASESATSTSADGGVSLRSGDAPLPSRPDRLWRRDVVAALSRGLGDFLSRLQVEPVVAAGKFHGWRIVKLRAGDPLWQNTDLAPGDIVTAVNARPIERPEQAFAAFQSLAVAKELRVSYQRASARREIVYPIDDTAAAP